MTTYELPPEPPIGKRVKDAHGTTWTRTNDGWSHPDLTSSGVTWGAVLNYAGPVTLIEPDPWPTAPLIVASVDGGGPQLLSIINRHAAVAMTSAIVRRTEHTLTNVVPVTVVPTAEWRRLRETLAAADAGDFDFFLGSFRALIAATDALGVDL